MKSKYEIREELILYEKDISYIVDKINQYGHTTELKHQLEVYQTAVEMLKWVLN